MNTAKTSNELSEWTSDLENHMQYIGNCSRGYVWMYQQDIQKYSAIFQRFSNVGIAFGIIAGCLGSLSLGFQDTQALVAISSVLAFGTSLCEGYLRKCDFEGKIGDLKRQTIKYAGIVNNIRRQLGLPRNKRERADDYQKWITQNYQELNEIIIIISPEVVAEYKVKCLLENLPYPDDVCPASNIVINVKRNEKDEGNENEEAKEEHDNGNVIDNGNDKPVGNGNVNEKQDEVNNTMIRNPSILQDALKFSDQYMKYELSRLAEQE